MTSNNKKHTITNEIREIRKLYFSYVAFLSTIEVLVVFNISSLHAKDFFS